MWQHRSPPATVLTASPTASASGTLRLHTAASLSATVAAPSPGATTSTVTGKHAESVLTVTLQVRYYLKFAE
jgi:hypothetical protein